MGAYGIFLIAALIIGGGVIAYAGDVIGRRMGRRRLTLFSLRPRHTAVAVSVFAGMLIAAFTLISAMLVSQNVRDAFLRVAAMRRENVRLERRLETTRSSLSQVSAAMKRTSGELAVAMKELRVAQRERDRLIAERDTQKRAVKKVQGELEARGRELASGRQELESTRATLASTNEELGKARKRLSDTQAALADKTTEIANATRIVTRVTHQVDDLWRQRDDLQAKIDALQAQIRDLTQYSTAALQTIGEIRSQPLIFGTNEEILTLVIQGGRAAADTRKDLDKMVALVNQVAIKAGAGARDNGRAIAFFSLAAPEGEDQPVYYSEDQVLDALATAISAARGSVIVRAASVRNVVKAETVLVHFELFHNQLVFHKGQELAQMSAQSSKDEASLMLDLVSFLRTKVSARAREAGVMARPAGRLGQGEELFSGPDEVVGEIRYPELLQVIRDIKSRKGSVRVIARAAADTWTAGPLQVKLEVGGRA